MLSTFELLYGPICLSLLFTGCFRYFFTCEILVHSDNDEDEDQSSTLVFSLLLKPIDPVFRFVTGAFV